jgi:hypothetical protein
VNARAVLKRTLVSLRGEPLSIRGDLSPEAAIAVINERLSGRWFAGGSTADRAISGRASANSITAWGKRPFLTGPATQVFKGRLVGGDTGCVLVGSMRTGAFWRAWFYLGIGFTCLFAADSWGLVVWHAIGGGLTLSMIGFALVATGFPLVIFGLCAWVVEISASDAAYLREWFSDCLSADAPDGHAPQYGSS